MDKNKVINQFYTKMDLTFNINKQKERKKEKGRERETEIERVNIKHMAYGTNRHT